VSVGEARARIFTNRERTVLVTIWPAANPQAEIVEVATRDEPGDIWSPPVRVDEERRD
jgi:hypothetical protein